MSVNKEMGDAHEEFLADLFEGRQTRGSGNQWANPIDGRQSRKHLRYAFAWDGKSTLGKSLSISLSMIDKAREQAGGERPMIGLRWYKTERLEVNKDWVAIPAYDMAEVLEAANKMALIEEQGCLSGNHDFWDPEGEPDIFKRHPEARSGPPVKGYPSSTCQVCGASVYDQAGA